MGHAQVRQLSRHPAITGPHNPYYKYTNIFSITVHQYLRKVRNELIYVF